MKSKSFSLYAIELIRLGIAEEQAALYFESMAPLCHSGAIKTQVYQLCAEANEQARQVSSVLATLPDPPHTQVTEMRPRIAEEIYSLTPSLDAFSISDATILDAVGHVHDYVHEQLRRTMAFANLIGENDKIQMLTPPYHDLGADPSLTSGWHKRRRGTKAKPAARFVVCRFVDEATSANDEDHDSLPRL